MYLDIGWTYGGVVSDFVQFSEHEEHHQDCLSLVCGCGQERTLTVLTGMCTPLYVHPISRYIHPMSGYVHPMSRYVPARDEVCLPFLVLVVLVSMYVHCYTV